MIPTPEGWMRLERADYVHLRSPIARPVGEIRYRELVQRPRGARRFVTERLALSPAFEIVAIGDPDRITTDEGEHAAVVRVDGKLAGRAVRRVIGMVVDEHLTAVIDGVAVHAEYVDELEQITRDLTRRAELGLGVRRRRFVYRRPAGWQALSHLLETYFIPPDHPRNAERIVVYPAIPRGLSLRALMHSTIEDQIGRIDQLVDLEESAIQAASGLGGRRWRVASHSGTGKARTHTIVVFEDEHYAYRLRLDEGAAPSPAFAAMCASVEPLGARRAVGARDRLAILAPLPPVSETALELTTAVAQVHRFVDIDVYERYGGQTGNASGEPLRELPAKTGHYHVVYAPHGGFTDVVRTVVRPRDRTPLVCELDEPHRLQHWLHLFTAGYAGALRATDVAIVPTRAVERVYRRVFEAWSARFGLPALRTVTLADAIDVDARARDERARSSVRRDLGVSTDDVVFASTLSLSPAVPQDRLVAAWSEVVARAPRAVLVLAQQTDERAYVDELRRAARDGAAASRIIVLDAPIDRGALLSAADVYLQLAPVYDEASPRAVLDAMAHGLPVIATRWASVAELVRDSTGISIDVHLAPVPRELGPAALGLPASTIARELATLATFDMQRATEAIVALAIDSDLRARLAASALAIVRRDHALSPAVDRRLALFDDVAAAASDVSIARPLVDVDDIVRAQASHRLASSTAITLVNRSAVSLLHDDLRARGEVVVAKLDAGATTVGEMTDDLAVSRMIAFGIVAPGATAARPPERTSERPRASRGSTRDRIAMLGAFEKLDESAPHGTNHAAYAYSVGLAATRRWPFVDTFHCRDPKTRYAPPEGVAVQRYDARELPAAPARYDAIYVAHGDQMTYLPHVLRPHADWAPVVCEVGTMHHVPQWQNLLVTGASGAVRETDGVIYASRAARDIHRLVWERWAERIAAPSPQTTVIFNAIDCDEYARDSALRDPVRAALGIASQDVAFLMFGRLSAHTKGDQVALVALWREVVATAPRTVLVLAGATEDRTHSAHLRRVAREAGIANRVIVVENPYETWPNARTALMSAADALVHVSTGLEETCSLVTLEAMAHGLPVVASRWAAAADVIREGEDGHLVDVFASPIPDELRASAFGRFSHIYNGEVARYAAVDGRQLVAAVLALATNADHRGRCSDNALRSVRARHSLAGAMRQRVEFIDELAARAEAAWAAAPPPAPLVDVADLMRALASPERV
ncbi:MAG: glycosyltransferase [Kofleriaceae bacterium]